MSTEQSVKGEMRRALIRALRRGRGRGWRGGRQQSLEKRQEQELEEEEGVDYRVVRRGGQGLDSR